MLYHRFKCFVIAWVQLLDSIITIVTLGVVHTNWTFKCLAEWELYDIRKRKEIGKRS